MPNFKEINEGIQAEQQHLVRYANALPRVTLHGHLKRLADRNKSNVLVYASKFTGPTPGRSLDAVAINLIDVRGFMQAVNSLDKNKKEKDLDLILHTPGGSVDNAEAIVNYLRQMFASRKMRVYVPYMAMSAGTMMCCAADEVFMGMHSALGPTDPQINGLSVGDFLEEYETMKTQLSPNTFNQRFPAGFIQYCERAKERAEKLTEQFLRDYQFVGSKDAEVRAKRISAWLANRKKHLSHARPLHFAKLKEKGLKVTRLEDDQELQDVILSVYHTLEYIFDVSPTIKIVGSHVPSGFFATQENNPLPARSS